MIELPFNGTDKSVSPVEPRSIRNVSFFGVSLAMANKKSKMMITTKKNEFYKNDLDAT